MFLVGEKADLTCDKMSSPVSKFKISCLLFLSCIKISHRKFWELESGLLGFTVTRNSECCVSPPPPLTPTAYLTCMVGMMIHYCCNLSTKGTLASLGSR